LRRVRRLTHESPRRSSRRFEVARTPRADRLRGFAGDDTIVGFGGADLIAGGTGFDTAYAGPGRDTVYGGTDDDTLDGGPGPDTVYGGGGADALIAGRGRDRLYPGKGRDVVLAGAGEDRIFYSRDFAADTIWCGADHDIVFVDVTPGPTGPDHFDSEDTFRDCDRFQGWRPR
jgi:Ca2+-binding RTX toxin-like protein